MKFSRVIASGLIFGASAVVGGALLVATTGPDDSNDDRETPFSTEPLAAFQTLPPAQLPDIPPAKSIMQRVGEGTVYEAITAGEVTGYLVAGKSGGVCAIISQAGTFGSACGDMVDVATGRVVLRLQFAETDPAVFLGVAPNDARIVSIGNTDVPVENNMWLARVEPDVSRFTMSGAASSAIVQLGDEPSTEQPAPGD